MKHYIFEAIEKNSGQDYEFVIFAKTQNTAYELVVLFQENLELVSLDWNTRSWETWDEEANQQHLDDVLARGEEGLGTYDKENGWRVIGWPSMRDTALGQQRANSRSLS